MTATMRRTVGSTPTPTSTSESRRRSSGGSTSSSSRRRRSGGSGSSSSSRIGSCYRYSSNRGGNVILLLVTMVAAMMMTTMTMMTIVTDVASAAAASTAGADLYDISEPVVVDGGGVGGSGGGDGPTLSTVLLLRLEYGISELQQTTDNIGVELYDEGCRDGRGRGGGNGDGEDNDAGEPYLVDDSVLATRVSLVEQQEGQDNNLLDVAVLMNPQTISQDPNIFVYDEDDDNSSSSSNANANIKFCVRVMLFVDSSLEIEVNYVETVVTVDVDLTDGFDVGEFQTAPKEQIDKRAFLPSQVEGFFCDDCFQRIEVKPNYKVVFNQGSFVRVCVRATDETLLSGVSIKQLWSFQYRRSQRNNDDLIQVAVQDGGLPSSDGLSEVDCPFPNLCVITTLLQAKFFPSPGVLVGEGFAILQINKDAISNDGRGRGLRRHRYYHRHHYHRQRHHLRQMQEQQAPAPLDQYWNITNPDFRFNEDTDDNDDGTDNAPETGTTSSSSKTLDFDLVYEISDAMSSENVVVDLYSKGCAIEGTLVSDIQQPPKGGGFDPSDGSSSSSVVITHSTVSDAVQTGLGYETQQVEYSVGLDPSKVVDYSQLYVESSNGGFGQVQLCARMSLFTGGGGEVNFWETPVVLNLNFQSNLLLDMTVLPPSSSSSVEDLQRQLPGLEPVSTYCSELSSGSSSSSSSSSLSLSEANGLEPRALDGVYIIPESLVAGIDGGDEEGSASGDVDLGPGFTWSSSASSSRLPLPLLLHYASSLHTRIFYSFVHIMVVLPILSTYVFV
eukprot:CAMPEP_0113452304 /NCGR_PEP_ID=MMETSP0014_2-20120614/6778_1 /TAXON_ID=2857 /ORGANISM="Nitzschia sp." /LENGTH=782 /DNA_ID=CAMNT_0000343673 /DNA_START=450 /DNA_END=2798 /DNA_ORIENTATION=- /assembly_acc=CAM_ASM_000159